MTNKDLVRNFYESVATENRLELIPEFISEDCVSRSGEETVLIGPEGMKQHFLAVRSTYPDFSMQILRQYAEGDTVITEFITRGTHQGEFIGITPTGKRLGIYGVNVDRVRDGKIVEHAGAANTFETFFEHGLIRPV